MTVFVGLTGGISTGKSQVSARLAQCGIPIIDCDLIAREVVAPNSPALAQIVARLGPAVLAKTQQDILLADGNLNRKAVGQLVFSQPDKKRILESITGPAIAKSLFAKALYYFFKGAPIVIIDAPTLFENGAWIARLLVKIIVVTSDEATQLDRLMVRDMCTREQALARVSSQLPLAYKVQRADYVVENDATLADLHQAVDGLLVELNSKYNRFTWRLLSAPGIAFLGTACFIAARLRHLVL